MKKIFLILMATSMLSCQRKTIDKIADTLKDVLVVQSIDKKQFVGTWVLDQECLPAYKKATLNYIQLVEQKPPSLFLMGMKMTEYSIYFEGNGKYNDVVKYNYSDWPSKSMSDTGIWEFSETENLLIYKNILGMDIDRYNVTKLNETILSLESKMSDGTILVLNFTKIK